MRCPFCAHDNSQVKDSRPSEDGAAIRRRRQCEECGARFTTFERVQLRDLIVLKKDNKREPFDRAKLERAVGHACRKRDIDSGRIDRLVTGIQRRLETRGDEVTTGDIGQAVMGCGGTVDYLVDAVFNYPTMSEAYKVAALDVANKIRALEAFTR